MMPKAVLLRRTLVVSLLAALGLLATAACGAQEAAPTPTSPPSAPTATNTPPPTSTSAPSQSKPTATTGVVAAPTATPTATPKPASTVQPKRGGIIRYTGAEDPPSFDPHTATSAQHNTHNAKMYSNLLWNPNRSEIVPDAAESYAISADGKVWTFKLRPNVKYHTGYSPASPRDGTTMNSRDVKWSLEKIMGLHGQTLSARSGWMKEFIDIDRPDNGIEIVDDLTFKIYLIQAFPGLANIMTIGFSGIMPENITTKELQKRPYGTGPFKLKTFQRGAVWNYERNPDYFKAGLPYLDGYQHNNMDGAAIIQAAFLTGKLDMAGTPTDDNKPIYDQREKAGIIYTLPPASSECRPASVNMNSTKPPFNEKRLRQAVNMAIDREAYTEIVHNGYGAPHIFLDTGGWGRSMEEIMKMPATASHTPQTWKRPKKSSKSCTPMAWTSK
ncbi:MAG: ABC transporter substrate-binding protein [Chloroflexi bacterium]|nr:ABC transporter substrate-binding protein [Chloroflexota bacterium]